MKRYAKLLVLPAAFLGLASVSAANYTLTEDPLSYLGEAANGTTVYAALDHLDTFATSNSGLTSYIAGKVVGVDGTPAILCTESDIEEAEADAEAACHGGTAGVTEKTPAVEASKVVDITAVTLADSNNLTINGLIEVSKLTAGKNTIVTVASTGTLRGDVKTAGSFVRAAGSSYSGSITYDTVGKPGVVSATDVSEIAEGKVTVSWVEVPGAKSYTLYRATSKDGSYTTVKAGITDTEYEDKTLAAGKTYFYKVAAKGANGTLGSKSDAMETGVTAGIPAPETLSVKAESYKSVKITAGKVTGATGYVFYRCETNCDAADSVWKRIKAQTSNIYTDSSSDLVSGHEYFYTAAAYVTNDGAKSYGKVYKDGFDATESDVTAETAYTDAKSATPKLGKPTISKVVAASTLNKVKITLTKVTGADGYVVFNNGSEVCRTTSTTCTTTALVIGDLNTFTAVAYRDATLGESPIASATVAGQEKYSELSSEKEYTIKPEAPKLVSSKVELLDVTGEDTEDGHYDYYNTVKVTVNDYSSKVSEESLLYVLYKATSKNGTYSKVAEQASNVFYVTDLSVGKTYYFKAKVKVNAKLSSYSSVQSKTTKMTPYGKNSDSEVLTATAKDAETEKYLNRTVVLKLHEVAGATGYTVYRSTSKSGKYTAIKTVSAASLSENDYIVKNTKLTAGQKYYYKVRAYKTVNSKKVYGEYSSIVSATPKLKAVTGLELGDITKKTVELSWDKVAGATGYRVYNQDDELVATTTKASVTVKGLEAGTDYSFYVKAYSTLKGKKKLGEASEPIPATTESSSN